MAMSADNKNISFYLQCIENGYTDMKDETQSLKAKVIAMDLNLRYKNIESLFAESKAVYEAQLAKEEKLSVDGELVMKLYNYAGDDKKDKEISIFRKPDSGFYLTINGGKKIHQYPRFFVNDSITLDYKYNPGKLIYTGASAGGIHMGGTHYQAPSISERAHSTGKGQVMLGIGEESYHIKRAKFPDIVVERFHREPIFKKHYKRGYYSLMASYYIDDGDEDAMRISLRSGDTYGYTSVATLALSNMLHPKATCKEMVSFLERVLRNDFPKSDTEIYESVAAVSETSSAKDIKHAVKELETISGYKPADELRKKLQPRYEQVLLQEKEEKALRRDRAMVRRGKLTPFAIAAAILLVIAYFVFFSPPTRLERKIERVCSEFGLICKDVVVEPEKDRAGYIGCDATITCSGFSSLDSSEEYDVFKKVTWLSVGDYVISDVVFISDGKTYSSAGRHFFF